MKLQRYLFSGRVFCASYDVEKLEARLERAEQLNAELTELLDMVLRGANPQALRREADEIYFRMNPPETPAEPYNPLHGF